MSTELHTFMDIFSADFLVADEIVNLKQIVIPIIQRDYAQGRKDSDVKRVRKRFLASLKNAIVGNPITLDFIYGDIDSNGIMTPLDGQQRLTTLFLLHWYAAKKENIDINEYKFLEKFSYETRYSARDFCDLLVNEYTPSFEGLISEEIIDQAWFPLDWAKDSTISSMLVMLDAIHETFGEVSEIWNKLKTGNISFYFLPIKDMGLTDELYIKMNSRGKPLTQFEHFKAELEHGLREIDENVAKRIMRKIDIDWTDMLWQYRGKDNVTDDEFLRYFRFICDIICYQNGGTTQGKSSDEFDLQQEYFSKENENAIANIEKMESYFDCWCSLDDISPEDYISKFVSYEHEEGKIQIENRYKLDIFGDCLRNYADVNGNGNRSFPLNRIILLFAFVTYLQNRQSVTDEDFARRIRIINNLVQNSEDEISDSEHRTSGNRMPAILRQVEKIVLTGIIDKTIDKSLNTSQIEEEILKVEWLKEHPELEESLFILEDHELLQGQISIVGTEHPEYFERFASLFSCNWDLIDCALMSIGQYGQKEKNGWRYQLGSSSNRNVKSWRTLFHKSGNSGFDETKRILGELLDMAETFDDELLLEIKSNFIALSEENSIFDLRYYYVKYDLFRPGSYGKYTWNDYTNKPYELAIMLTETKWSENTYQPFLKAVDADKLSRDDLGQYIVLSNIYIDCENDAYVIYDNETDEEIDRLPVLQNENGIDIEDRIIKLKNEYASIKDKHHS